MIFLKKLSILLFLFIFILNNILNVSAIEPIAYKELILSRNELNKTLKGKKYINRIDKLVLQIGVNKEILEKLESETNVLKEKLKNDISSKNEESKNIITYLNTKIQISLEDVSKIEIIEKINYISTLTTEEKKKIEEELVKIQLNLLDNTSSLLNVLIKDFEKLSNYEEKGNFKMNFNLDQKQIGKVDAKLDFSNYVVKKSYLDSQINGKIDAKYNFKSSKKNENLSLSTFIDFISNDSNIFLLLKDLNISKENLDFLNSKIEEIKSLAKDNKYIKFNNENSKQALSILKSLTPSKIMADGKNILSKSMFDVYKKNGDKYYLKPTKYACDKTKEILNKFDPFNGIQCSESQYKKMLKDLSEVGEIYIILGTKNTTLGFEGIKSNRVDSLTGSITFSSNSIEKLYFSAIPNQTNNSKEGLKIEYNKNKNLNFSLNIDSGKIDYNFVSNLDSNNNFSYINYSGKTLSSYNELTSNLLLNDKKINGDFKLISKYYDYKTKTTKLSNAISGTIKGTTDNLNKLDSLKIKYIGDNADNGKFLDGNFIYSNSTFSLNNYTNYENSKSNLELNAKWDSNYKIIKDGDILFEVFSKKGDYDYNTNKYIYSGDFEKKLNINYIISNKNILGSITYYNDIIEDLKIKSNGKYDNKYFKLNNEIILGKNLSKSFSEGYNSVAHNSGEKLNIKNSILNLNLLFDQRLNKNIITIYLDLIIDNIKTIEFNLDNKSQKEFKNVKIISPISSNVINYENIK